MNSRNKPSISEREKMTREEVIDFLIRGLKQFPGNRKIGFFGGEDLTVGQAIKYLEQGGNASIQLVNAWVQMDSVTIIPQEDPQSDNKVWTAIKRVGKAVYDLLGP
ncbi:hypothetical protein KJ764_04375 [Patescibacteria group bacterium]|nr:hypothetical protein [Patescibacteria group bacterium]